MGRPKKSYTPQVEAELAARTARGESAKTIRAALGNSIPLSTISLRQQELRVGGRSPPRPRPPAVPPAGDVPDVVPPEASEKDIDRWLALIDGAAKQAEKQENWAAVASLGAKFTALQTLKMKHAPLPPVDLSAGPDYKALAATGRDRFLKLVEGVFNESEGLGSEEARAPA